MLINMITIRIKTLLLALLSAMCAVAQSADRRAIVVDQNIKTNPAKGEFATVNEALRHAEKFVDDTLWTDILIAPGVYWIDDPDDEAVRRPEPGDNTPYGMKVRLNRTRLIGQCDNPEDVVLACNRGQTHGAAGNFTMLHITGNEVEVENITFGNYCNVDLDYRRNPALNRKKRADAIVQAQLVICNGDDYRIRNCRFISRLNLCPFVGARRVVFDDCYFECTDDALCGTGIYRHCRFTFYSSKPFYATSPRGAVFEDCDIHSKVRGTQYLTKVSDKVTMRNCRWTSDDPNLKIEWTKRPDPRHVCLMEGCTLNDKPYHLPPTPDVPMAVTTPTVPLMGSADIVPGRWTFDCYKPTDTNDYNWTVTDRPAWCFGEGVDGAEGCFGMIQSVRGARMMYTGLDGEEYAGQTLTVELAPCKSAGQGFGSATSQYLDICMKFDTRTLTGYGLRFIRTPKYDRAVETYLVEYQNGTVAPLTSAEKCVLFCRGCKVVLVAEGDALRAEIINGESVQTLSAVMPRPNSFGGIHLQHTGTTGASATVVQSVKSEYR